MNGPGARPAGHPAERVVAAVLLGAIVWLFVVRFRLSQTTNINWDEFYFLSKVHLGARGALSGKLLTFHSHLFPWVLGVDENEARQVLALRVVMWGVSIAGAGAAAFIGWRLFRHLPAALFAVFCGGTVSFVLNHGSAARFDPLVVTLFLVAAALLLVRGRVAVVVAGAAFALALLVSIKAVFYGPSLLIFLACRFLDDRDVDARRARADVVAFVVAVIVVFGVLFAAHVATLVGVAGSGGGDGTPALRAIFQKVFFGERFAVPKHLMATLRFDTVFWGLLLAGLCLAVGRIDAGAGAAAERRVERRAMVRVAALALPLLSLVVYRNAYAYFYVSVVPPAALLCGVVVARLKRSPFLCAAVTLGLTLLVGTSASRWAKKNGRDHTGAQIAVVDAVHRVFPTPVPYVDRCSMIASFDKVGPFMSTWTLGEYRKKGQPVLAPLLATTRPLFVLANVESLNLARNPAHTPKSVRLLPEDAAALQRGYIPWWGPIWIAGRRVDVEAGVGTDVDIVVPGAYVVEGSDVVVDGAAVAEGAVVELAAGVHRVESAVKGTVTLRTAAARPPPKEPPPTEKLFRSFAFAT